MYHIIKDSNLYSVSQRVSHLKGRIHIQHQFLVVHYSLHTLLGYLKRVCQVKPLFQSFPQILVTFVVNQ